ncbi:MAG: DUF1269 domain-containing protein, partial [Chamaesiphon sp.]|nr:DUF1269 domain-containing protein [Chamaesiphon sp.]
LKLEQENLLDLDDSVVVTKNTAGKIRVKLYNDLTSTAPELGNELWGGIISAVVFHRELEIAQHIFEPSFLTEVETSLKPNSSALFVLVRSAQPEPVLAALAGVGGEIVRTTLSESLRLKLRDALMVV